MRKLIKIIMTIITGSIMLVVTLAVIAAAIEGPSKANTAAPTDALVVAPKTRPPLPPEKRIEPKVEPAEKPSEPKAEPLVISADALFQAYEDNIIAAEETYGKKEVIVIGRIDDIGTDIVGTPYVTLDAGDSYIQCMFSKADKPTLAKCSKGTKVAITGNVSGGKILGIFMRNCAFVNPTKQATPLRVAESKQPRK